jgi:hypothetical protein
VSPLAELRAGRPGEAFLTLLSRTVLAVAITRNFPPPDGGSWNGAKANDVAVSFLTHERTPKRLDWLVLHAGDDAALAGALQGLVRNFLRDLGRATEMGRLVVRIRRALRESDAFVAVDGDRWALSGGPADAAEVGPDELVSAAAKVPVTFQAWSPTALRHEPFADRDSIDGLLVAVLEAAAGSLRPADLAHAIAPSLQVVTGPVTLDIDAGDHPDGDVGGSGSASDDLGDDVVNRARAREVFQLLSDRERIALAYVHLNLRELAPVIGLGRSQAAIVRNRAVDVLQAELADEEQGQEIAELVLDIGRTWVQDRTGSDDLTYNSA